MTEVPWNVNWNKKKYIEGEIKKTENDVGGDMGEENEEKSIQGNRLKDSR